MKSCVCVRTTHATGGLFEEANSVSTILIDYLNSEKIDYSNSVRGRNIENSASIVVQQRSNRDKIVIKRCRLFEKSLYTGSQSSFGHGRMICTCRVHMKNRIMYCLRVVHTHCRLCTAHASRLLQSFSNIFIITCVMRPVAAVDTSQTPPAPCGSARCEANKTQHTVALAHNDSCAVCTQCSSLHLHFTVRGCMLWQCHHMVIIQHPMPAVDCLPFDLQATCANSTDRKHAHASRLVGERELPSM